MIYFDQKRKLLMESEYRYSLQEREDPHLYRDIFPYREIPKCTFNQRVNPIDPANEIWITDTTFRDGQQSRAPYTPEQIVTLFKMLSKLGGPRGVIRQSEFFLYSEADKIALRKCQELGLSFPEITGWIRATKKDFELAKDLGLKECGILVSCSDYHIFNKLKMNRTQAINQYLSIVAQALMWESGRVATLRT